MLTKLCLSLVVLQLGSVAAELQWQFPPPDVADVRRVTPSIFAAGRPNRDQITKIAKSGFASLVSVYTLPATNLWNSMTGDFVSTDDYAAIGKSLGLTTRVWNFTTELHPWTDPKSFEEFAKSMDSLPKPVLVHCHVGYSASALAFLYAIRTGGIPASEFYSRTVSQGWEFQTNPDVNKLWASVAGASKVPETIKGPTLNLRLNKGSGYRMYYRTKRINDDWYVSGLPNISTELDSLKASGYGAVVSLLADGEQAGPMWPNGTYSAGVEGMVMNREGIPFFSAPLTPPLSADKLATVGLVLAKAAAASNNSGAVLVHCSAGYRSTAAVLAHVGVLEKRNWQWALRTAEAIGYSYWDEEGSDTTTDALVEALRSSRVQAIV